MARIPAAISVVVITAIAIGINIARFPVVWEMAGNVSQNVESTSAASTEMVKKESTDSFSSTEKSVDTGEQRSTSPKRKKKSNAFLLGGLSEYAAPKVDDFIPVEDSHPESSPQLTRKEAFEVNAEGIITVPLQKTDSAISLPCDSGDGQMAVSSILLQEETLDEPCDNRLGTQSVNHDSLASEETTSDEPTVPYTPVEVEPETTVQAVLPQESWSPACFPESEVGQVSPDRAEKNLVPMVSLDAESGPTVSYSDPYPEESRLPGQSATALNIASQLPCPAPTFIFSCPMIAEKSDILKWRVSKPLVAIQSEEKSSGSAKRQTRYMVVKPKDKTGSSAEKSAKVLSQPATQSTKSLSSDDAKVRRLPPVESVDQ